MSTVVGEGVPRRAAGSACGAGGAAGGGWGGTGAAAAGAGARRSHAGCVTAGLAPPAVFPLAAAPASAVLLSRLPAAGAAAGGAAAAGAASSSAATPMCDCFRAISAAVAPFLSRTDASAPPVPAHGPAAADPSSGTRTLVVLVDACLRQLSPRRLAELAYLQSPAKRPAAWTRGQLEKAALNGNADAPALEDDSAVNERGCRRENVSISG